MIIVILASSGVAFAFMGLAGMLAPDRISRQFEVSALTRAGRSEVRAVYGGFGLATAGALGLAMAAPWLRSGIMLTVGVGLLGMALGRAISAVLDRGVDDFPRLYGALELLGAALLIGGALA